MQVNYYSTFIYLFESGKCEKEGKKYENLQNEKSFLDEIKNIFQFLKGYQLANK